MIKGKKICFECTKQIDTEEEHYVQLSTFNRFTTDDGRRLPDDHNYFHFQCFVDNFNKNVERKARQMVQFMQSEAIQLVNHPMIKDVLSKIEGSNMVVRMLNTDLNKDTIVAKEKVIERLRKNGRNGKRKKNR